MTPDPDKPLNDVTLAALLDVAAHAVLAEFRVELEGAGYAEIRPTHGCVFRFIRGGEGIRLTELAAFASMTKQSVGEIVDDLVALGYVERIPDPADRRAKLIRLTPKGVQAREVGSGLFERIEESWAERYGTERVAELRQLLEEIVSAEAPDAVPELSRPVAAGAGPS
jgi:DNA-binding MarR family transcriptional regulator